MSSRDFYLKSKFFLTWRFLSQVENCFSRRDFYRKSIIFSLVENFIASRDFFSCREFFHAKIFPFKSRF